MTATGEAVKLILSILTVALLALGSAWLLLHGPSLVFGGVPSPVALAAAEVLVQATIYSADWCAPCRSYVAAVRREMPPDGWRIADSGDKDQLTAHVVISKTYTRSDRITRLPTTVIRRGPTEVARIVGPITPTQLAERINDVLKQ